MLLKKKLNLSVLINLPGFYKFLYIMICFFSCSSNEEECIKTVTIQQFYTVGNEIHSYNQEIDIPCGVNEVTEPVNIEPPLLDGFSYEVINFEYTSDTGNNTTRLQFEIKLKNSNNYPAKGFPYFTVSIDGLESSTKYANFLNNSCGIIKANSSCTVILDIEESHVFGIPNSIELIDVKYYLTKE